jgi:hypothetical protein
MMTTSDHDRYLRCISASKRVRWDVDRDVIKGRRFDPKDKYLPDGLSLVGELATLSADERRLASQIQGRTYANVFGLSERFINAKVLELSRDHWFGDQVALEALVRFSDEELKHQALFRAIETLIGESMPEGYSFDFDPDAVAGAVLGKSSWAVLGLTLNIELFTQTHYVESIAGSAEISPLFKDVFQFHWKEECQHAILDELEWKRCDAGATPAERDRGVDDLIALVGAVDGILQAQSAADAAYFSATCGRSVDAAETGQIRAGFLKAYRWQFILSGANHPHFSKVLSGLTTDQQQRRIQEALATLA